jgi:hypothetical protein
MTKGATWIKFYTDIKQAEAKAAIDEAHKLGMKVTGHICSLTFQEAAALGFDNIEHGMLTATDFYEGKTKDVCSPDSFAKIGANGNPTGPVAKATINAMVAKKIPMTSTLAVFEAFVPNRPCSTSVPWMPWLRKSANAISPTGSRSTRRARTIRSPRPRSSAPRNSRWNS